MCHLRTFSACLKAAMVDKKAKAFEGFG